MCGSRKYPYPPPRKVTGNSEGEGGSKAEISECSVVTSVNHTSTRSKGTPASLVVVASMESVNQTCV